MKKLVKISILALTVAIAFPSCKKGEDDPFISLLSRKARVAGEWRMDFREEVRNNTLVSPSLNSNSTETTSIVGTNYTYTFTDASGSNSQTGTIAKSAFTFEKDGNWNSSFEITTVNILGVPPFETKETKVVLSESSGIWNFLGKIGEAKNKENISVSTTTEKTTTTLTIVDPFLGTSTDVDTETETYAGNEMVEVWKITQLKNKELKAEIEINNSSITSSTTKKVSGSIKVVLNQD